MNIKIKYLLTASLAMILSACTNPNNNVPIQSNNDGGYNGYQDVPINNPPITNSQITNTDALAVGAVGVATGYALGKYANKPKYSKPSSSYSKPVVVVNKHYYQGSSNATHTKYKSTYRKRK
jgi:hypothetical protein